MPYSVEYLLSGDVRIVDRKTGLSGLYSELGEYKYGPLKMNRFDATRIMSQYLSAIGL